ncbi:selenide, water dikinase SelD [Parashewanella spongiae]|uniref:Selenide, water dikinase n=1 Tax=Parashewanella spongiae TaxID=342950 RepID=A0A3A6TWL3_9GAMM|nr:selenide, water dikinase SelD [Parashewanella spongiae]MCL1077163.1 selenide, water dikinase SelD [Parashewanella spongiae]RJY18813.1 selenide, water dikinase SelD [Parashewanella spongiae]
MPTSEIKLTQYSHGAGCGCKISPKVLNEILSSQLPTFNDPNLLVGNDTRDDAAVYQLDEHTGIISTTDFFMPIVDDPFTFGRIAATNAISDIYAMGGSPMMAIAILGWPVNKLPAEVASKVIDGGRQACKDAGVMLAGGHSIDAPEPIFGLAVTGQVSLSHLKRNSTAQTGDKLYLTKPIGIGIHTTAQKKQLLRKSDASIAIDAMCQLNRIGSVIAKMSGVHAMTDVTGFGLGGHLIEMCQGANLSAKLDFSAIPLLEHTQFYIDNQCIPGGSQRNYDSYGQHLPTLSPQQQTILCDPQTSGGLLVAVAAEAENRFIAELEKHDCLVQAIGEMTTPSHTSLIELV